MDVLRTVSECNCFYIAGVLTTCAVSLKVFLEVYAYFYTYLTAQVIDYRKYGKWALVTGATDGIGKGIARDLARQGVSILLISRNPEKLQRVVDEIREGFGVDVDTLVFDFSQLDDVTGSPSPYDVIEKKIAQMEIGILVNNVGMTDAGTPDEFTTLQANGERAGMALVNCNVVAMVKMTQLVLAQMDKRKRGLIINLSSAFATMVGPYWALYSGSKRFNDNFSKTTSYEYEKRGITIQSIQPGWVATNMTQEIVSRKGSLFSPTYNTYGRHALRCVGKNKMNHGYWGHGLQIGFLKQLPDSFIAWILKQLWKDAKEKRNWRQEGSDKKSRLDTSRSEPTL